MKKEQGLDQSGLGQQQGYPEQYDASVLFPVSRAHQRRELHLESVTLPFQGVDIWTAYELSWLTPSGKPDVGVGELVFPCQTPNIIESKSLKLYLNSLNNTVFASTAEVVDTIQNDLSACSGGAVGVTIQPLDNSQDALSIEAYDGQVIDALDVNIRTYKVDPALLKTKGDADVSETLVSHLLRSTCPVTGQPDWASVWIDYSGPQICHRSLLAYIVSFRHHQEFHEHCVERIFTDIHARCHPTRLSVYARFTRRGGIDINPFRGSHASQPKRRYRQVRQ